LLPSLLFTQQRHASPGPHAAALAQPAALRKNRPSGPAIPNKYKQPETSPLTVTVKASPDNELETLNVSTSP
jgi:hypothetical protein